MPQVSVHLWDISCPTHFLLQSLAAFPELGPLLPHCSCCPVGEGSLSTEGLSQETPAPVPRSPGPTVSIKGNW